MRGPMRDPRWLRAELLHLYAHHGDPERIRKLEIEVAWTEHELGWDAKGWQTTPVVRPGWRDQPRVEDLPEPQGEALVRLHDPGWAWVASTSNGCTGGSPFGAVVIYASQPPNPGSCS
jgi:hypothetical protein